MGKRNFAKVPCPQDDACQQNEEQDDVIAADSEIHRRL
jgi:hypothetical protein